MSLEGTVKLPGVKAPVNKKALVIGGAVAAGVVGYAYYQRLSGVSGDFEEEPVGVVDEMGDERIDPRWTGGSEGTFDQTPTGYQTDQEWFNAAIDLLIYNFGVADTATASDALNRYMSGKGLTTAQVSMIQYVVNSLGPPPSGAKPIKHDTSNNPASTGLLAPKNLKYTSGPGSITFKWDAVSGATNYEAELIQGTSTRVRGPVIVSATSWTINDLAIDKPYRINVYGRNAGGQRGARGTLVGRTGKSTTKPPTGGPPVSGKPLPAPSNIRHSANWQDITFTWTPVPGAKAYGIELIQGTGQVIDRRLVPEPRYRVGGGLQPGKPYRIRVSSINNQNKPGPSRSYTGRTDRK